MIPPVVGSETKSEGEIQLFERLRDDPGTEDWIVLHSLDLPEHVRQVEGEVDFVVVVPGDGVLCIEVKAHHFVRRSDEGMWQLGRSGSPSRRSPFKQASEGMHSLRKRLHRDLPFTKRMLTWSAVIFTHADFQGQHRPSEWHRWQCIDASQFHGSDSIGVQISSVLNSARGHVRHSTSSTWFDPDEGLPSKKQAEQIAKCLRPEFEMYQSRSTRAAIDSRDMLRYTDEQFDILDSIADANCGRIVVNGPAGTGKTVLALETARRAASSGQRVALFCYNRLLGSWLRDAAVEGVIAGTLHSFMLHASQATVPPNARTEFWDSLPDLALERLLESDVDQFDLIILDEAQDLMDTPFLDVIDAALVGGIAEGRWFCFGDFDYQVIFGKRGGLAELDARVGFPAPRFPLRRNCRNTPEVSVYAERFGGLDPGYSGTLKKRTGIKPEFRFFEDHGEQPTMLVKLLTELVDDGFQPHEIAVLSAVRDELSVAVRVDGPWTGRLYRAGSDGSVQNANFCTVNAFKGLERPVVILTDFHEVGSSSARDQFYTGFTRATERTYVLASESAKTNLIQMIMATKK